MGYAPPLPTLPREIPVYPQGAGTVICTKYGGEHTKDLSDEWIGFDYRWQNYKFELVDVAPGFRTKRNDRHGIIVDAIEYYRSQYCRTRTDGTTVCQPEECEIISTPGIYGHINKDAPFITDMRWSDERNDLIGQGIYSYGWRYLSPGEWASSWGEAGVTVSAGALLYPTNRHRLIFGARGNILYSKNGNLLYDGDFSRPRPEDIPKPDPYC